MQTYYSYLPCIEIPKKDSFWREFWVEKVTVLWSEANLEPSQTSFMERLCEKNQVLKAVTYFCKNLHHRGLTEF